MTFTKAEQHILRRLWLTRDAAHAESFDDIAVQHLVFRGLVTKHEKQIDLTPRGVREAGKVRLNP